MRKNMYVVTPRCAAAAAAVVSAVVLRRPTKEYTHPYPTMHRRLPTAGIEVAPHYHQLLVIYFGGTSRDILRGIQQPRHAPVFLRFKFDFIQHLLRKCCIFRKTQPMMHLPMTNSIDGGGDDASYVTICTAQRKTEQPKLILPVTYDTPRQEAHSKDDGVWPLRRQPTKHSPWCHLFTRSQLALHTIANVSYVYTNLSRN